MSSADRNYLLHACARWPNRAARSARGLVSALRKYLGARAAPARLLFKRGRIGAAEKLFAGEKLGETFRRAVDPSVAVFFFRFFILCVER